MASMNANDPAVLTCWKDIAQYLGKGVRTVQRWEQEFGLPVRRPNGMDHKSPVAAHPSDLNAWLQRRWSARNSSGEDRRQDSDNGLIPTARNNIQLTAEQSLELSEVIRTSRELRLAHRALMSETKMILQTLLNNCSELQELRDRSRAIKSRS